MLTLGHYLEIDLFAFVLKGIMFMDLLLGYMDYIFIDILSDQTKRREIKYRKILNRVVSQSFLQGVLAALVK